MEFETRSIVLIKYLKVLHDEAINQPNISQLEKGRAKLRKTVYCNRQSQKIIKSACLSLFEGDILIHLL